MRAVTALTFDRATTENYREILPFVQRIVNTTFNVRTQSTAAKLIYGNAIDLDANILLPRDEINLDMADPLRVEPLDVARHDYMEFYIENIRDLQRKTSLEFLVRWLGYTDEHNSRTSYANLRDTEKLHEYLTSNNLQGLIPRKFTNVVDTNI